MEKTDMSRIAQTRVIQLLAEAMELPEGQRASFLDSTCADELDLRREIEELLKVAEPAAHAFEAASDQLARADPDQIGPYTILEPIGEGGMAIVYRAEQHHPVRRIVALKLMKLGMDTRQFVARFEAERQALAMMDHPNVAQVYDAGSTDTGRPYFVMEYVPGRSILQYCDEKGLGVRRRLELFISVCEAVEHAHQKGIIHRDLKDSNVLITEIGGKSVPKVIDFGVAKAISQRLTDRTMFTEQGQLIGTPEYMSPEQAERGALGDIDTRSDVYSLGVLLYELISGVQPIPSDVLRSAGFEEVQRIIRETDPQRPSTRLSTLAGADGTRIAQRRSTALPTLIRSLRSELEWIPLKAMRKDREQRYRSASELADDIRNYLDGRPLLAGPESGWYRMRKLLRRHRIPVASAVAVLLAVLLGSSVAVWQAIRATRAVHRALSERDNARATLEFLTSDVLAGATPENIPDAKVRDQIVAAMITPAAKRAGEAFADRPLAEASVRAAIQSVLREIGRADLALAHAEAALAIRRRELGDDDPDTLASLNDYGRVLRGLGGHAEAATVYADALARRRRVLGDDHPDTISSLNNYATTLEALGRATEAEPLLKEALERRRRLLGDDDPKTLISLSNYAHLLKTQRRFAEAEPLDLKALERRRRVLGEDHPQTLMSLNNYALVLKSLGRYAEAEPLYKLALERYRRVMGEDHPATLTALNNYGVILREMGRLTEAEPLLKAVYERRRQLSGEDHPNTILSLGLYADVLRLRGRYEDAEVLAGEAVAKAIACPSLGPAHEWTRNSATLHAQLLQELGRASEAASIRKQFNLPPTTARATTRPAIHPG
jgi:serine/threonine protein kinase